MNNWPCIPHYFIACLTEQHMNQNFKIVIFVFLNRVFWAKTNFFVIGLYHQLYKKKTVHQTTHSRNALVPSSLLKKLQTGSCAVLSNRHRYTTAHPLDYRNLSIDFSLYILHPIAGYQILFYHVPSLKSNILHVKILRKTNYILFM